MDREENRAGGEGSDDSAVVILKYWNNVSEILYMAEAISLSLSLRARSIIRDDVSLNFSP